MGGEGGGWWSGLLHIDLLGITDCPLFQALSQRSCMFYTRDKEEVTGAAPQDPIEESRIPLSGSLWGGRGELLTFPRFGSR